jgi:hypothetical protein
LPEPNGKRGACVQHPQKNVPDFSRRNSGRESIKEVVSHYNMEWGDSDLHPWGKILDSKKKKLVMTAPVNATRTKDCSGRANPSRGAG